MLLCLKRRGAAQRGGGEDEDSDEDEEPALKYERIGGFLPEIFQRDSASALLMRGDTMVSELMMSLQSSDAFRSSWALILALSIYARFPVNAAGRTSLTHPPSLTST